MRIRIEAFDLPGPTCGPSPQRPAGHEGILVGVQQGRDGSDLVGLTPASASSATWVLDCTASGIDGEIDLRGPCVQGRPGGRFVYLSWLASEADGGLTRFRRAKLHLDAVPGEVLADAARRGVLVGRLGLTDPKGNPLCAAVRPPLIRWTAASA